MKKIICLIESLGSGGAERQLTYLASQLKGKGHDIEVWTYYPDDFYAHVLNSAGVKWRFISEAQSKSRRVTVLKRELAKANPDTVIAYLDTCTSIACIIKLLGAKFKLLVSERNTTQKLTLRERIKFFLYRWADCIVPNSYTQTKYIIDHYPSLADKVHTITNFVDTEKFRPPTIKVANDKLRILTVARVDPQKNVLRLLEAVKLLKAAGYRFKYDWFGSFADKEYHQRCIDTMLKYEIEDVFEFHDHARNIVEEYQTSDVFCLPSLFEGFPNVVCEAMSCGVPVVCSGIDEHRIIVGEVGEVFLFDPRSVSDIYKKMSCMLGQNPFDISALGQECRKVLLEHFDSRAFLNSYVKLL